MALNTWQGLICHKKKPNEHIKKKAGFIIFIQELIVNIFYLVAEIKQWFILMAYQPVEGYFMARG